MKQIDTCGLSFPRLRDEDYYYVDKSLLIKDILDWNPGGVYLFTRPRRFGKTTNLSMLNAFFNIEYKGNTWFDGLEISKYPEYEKYKNAFPVIYLNLKGTNVSDYKRFIEMMAASVSDAFEKHNYLLKTEIRDSLREMFKTLDNLSISESNLVRSVKLLSEALMNYHGKKVIILIDEYDRAVSDSFGEESHRPMMSFLGEFLSSILKNNDSLQMAYITGIMQITKESIFSGLNNLKVNNVFSVESDERFGFTESEVKELLSYYGNPEKFAEAKEWYDGYRFGDADVYNPFSIMNYVQDRFVPGRFWVNSGSDAPIYWLLRRTDMKCFSDILSLVSGESVTTRIKPALTYSKLGPNDSLYSLMVMSGYLKAVPVGDGLYSISIPNKEILGIIGDISEDLSPIDTRKFSQFINSVLDCDAEGMTRHLQDILSVGSYYNLSTELHYEAVVMTVLYSIISQYDVRSEYEEGNGRVDIIMKPKHEGTIPMIIELKKTDSEDKLESESKDAIKQIHDRKYYLNMHGKVILVGIAFWGKMPKTTIETIFQP